MGSKGKKVKKAIKKANPPTRAVGCVCVLRLFGISMAFVEFASNIEGLNNINESRAAPVIEAKYNKIINNP